MQDGRGALAGVRVLEIADEKGLYCGKLLADMGADVVKIERPGGDTTRAVPPFVGEMPHPDGSLFFLYHNTGKRSVTIDLELERGREVVSRLASNADVLLETLPVGALDSLGLGYEKLRDRNPRLVVTSITGFGQTGPRASWASADIVVSALGGSMHVTGSAEDPPVVLAGSQAWIAASTCAAAATSIALRHARTTGRGQHVDISAEEVQASVTHICGVGKWLDDGIVARRLGTGLFASVPSGAYPCADGLVYLMINRPAHWKALARWINEVTGNAEVLDPMFEGPSSNRLPYRELLDIFICELTERWSVAHMYAEGQRRHLAFTPVNSALDVLNDEHLAARGAFVACEHPYAGTLRYPGAPYRHSATPWRMRRAPSAGEHNAEILGKELGLTAGEIRALARPASRRPRRADRPREVLRSAPASAGSAAAGAPAGSTAARVPTGSAAACALADVRVLELTAGMAGPWIGRFMAWCGADVIKVESKERPDVTRLYVPPRAPELGIQPQLSPWFTDWNAGKRFVALDLRKPAAVALCKRLAAHCDVVVVNYSAGVLDKLGLGYDVLRRERDDLIMLSSTGYGSSGPNRGYVTWGPNIEALCASSSLSGFPARPCTITQYAYPDALSALHGIYAVMCALEHRDRTGEGQHIDVSQYEVMVAALGHPFMEALAFDREPRRHGNASAHAVPHGCYRAAGEDRWCAIAVRSDEEWQRLCELLGLEALGTDARLATAAGRRRHAEMIDAAVERWTRERDAFSVAEALQSAGIAAGVVQTVEDLYLADPQLAARGFFETIPHARKGSVVATGIPLGLTATPGVTLHSGKAVGADNTDVFATLLGLSAEEIARHVAEGAIESG